MVYRLFVVLLSVLYIIVGTLRIVVALIAAISPSGSKLNS